MSANSHFVDPSGLGFLPFLTGSNTTDPTSTTNPPPGERTLRLTSPMMRGEDVRWVQIRVGAAPDGIYGPETTGKVQLFQTKSGIQPSGTVDGSTWSALQSASTTTSTENQSSPADQVSQEVSTSNNWTLYAAAAAGLGIVTALLVSGGKSKRKK